MVSWPLMHIVSVHAMHCLLRSHGLSCTSCLCMPCIVYYGLMASHAHCVGACHALFVMVSWPLMHIVSVHAMHCLLWSHGLSCTLCLNWLERSSAAISKASGRCKTAPHKPASHTAAKLGRACSAAGKLEPPGSCKSLASPSHQKQDATAKAAAGLRSARASAPAALLQPRSERSTVDRRSEASQARTIFLCSSYG
jgi:hypothetical protein